VPRTQRPSLAMTFFVRTQSAPMRVATSVEGTLHSMEPEAPVEIRTLEDVVGSTIARPRAVSMLVGVFALLALALAAIGVYGVMAYSVRERTQEIGVRAALGASPKAVFRLVLGQALRLVLFGLAAGLVAAAAFTRVLEGLLFQVEPLDPGTFAATTLVLLAVATIASYVPARRATHMTPADVLRMN